MQTISRRSIMGTSWLALAAVVLSAATSRADIAVKEGEKIGFLGDSITAGWA